MKTNDKYCISSRVRLARNVNGLPFSDRMTDEEMISLIDKVKGALGNEYTYINFPSLPKKKKLSYVEMHIVSPDFISSKKRNALFMNEDKSVAIMVGEEDHIRIQALVRGNDLKAALSLATKAEELIAKKIDFAFDATYGYITKCLTNVGTGMRASVMMFLPTTLNDRSISAYSAELARLGMTVRGVFGEGSASIGDMYQISNNVTLGISEDEIIDRVEKVVDSLSKKEEEHENALLLSAKEALTDKCMRALGTLKYAHMMSSKEAQTLLSTVRLGANLNIIDVDKSYLDTAFENSFPNTLSLLSSEELNDDTSRDIFRAKYLRELFEADHVSK